MRRPLLPELRDRDRFRHLLPLVRPRHGAGAVALREASTMESKGKTFRRLLQDEPYLFTGGIYSPLDAQIAEQAGMKSIYLSGYSLAMLNGWPDMASSP